MGGQGVSDLGRGGADLDLGRAVGKGGGVDAGRGRGLSQREGHRGLGREGGRGLDVSGDQSRVGQDGLGRGQSRGGGRDPGLRSHWSRRVGEEVVLRGDCGLVSLDQGGGRRVLRHRRGRHVGLNGDGWGVWQQGGRDRSRHLGLGEARGCGLDLRPGLDGCGDRGQGWGDGSRDGGGHGGRLEDGGEEETLDLAVGHRRLHELLPGTRDHRDSLRDDLQLTLGLALTLDHHG